VTILDGGLQAGQNVVVDGADRLRPGQIVTRQRGQTAQCEDGWARVSAGNGKNDNKGNQQ